METLAMPNAMAHPATGEELELEDAIFARFEDEEDDEWSGDGEEGWEDEDDLDEDDEWDDEDDEDWDEDEDEWTEGDDLEGEDEI
jgi:hypothetical protein